MKRQGFTLVELLVVITIIGILVGLTMPAVMSAIESSRRISCANNIRQIALATNQYETSLKQYPLNWGQVAAVGTPGTPSGLTGPGANGVSWLASLLPYIDQNPLYGMTGVAQGSLAQMPNGPGQAIFDVGYQNGTINNLTALSTPIPTFLCPSDTQRGTIGNQMLGPNGPFGTTNYKACAGSNWAGSSSLPPTSGTRGRNCNHTPVDGVDYGNGVICRGGATTAGGNPLVTANMDIRDGASKTFLVGEAVPEWCAWSLWFWFDGSTATCGVPLNYRISGTQPQFNSTDWQDTYSFMSRHKSGANFAMCDGSVPYINEQIDIQVYQALATIDGNEAVTADGSPVAVPSN